MDQSTLNMVLFGFTALAAVGLGIWQFVRVKKAKAEHNDVSRS